MSRSGYSEELEPWDLIRWRGQVASASRGKRGQRFFRDLLKALDEMPEKRLITEELEMDGEVCAFGALARAKGVDMSKLDPSEPDDVAGEFNIATQLAQEVVYMNDEHYDRETTEERFVKMRAWVVSNIREESAGEVPKELR